eukprot:671264-Rhodomonas_salina.1
MSRSTARRKYEYQHRPPIVRACTVLRQYATPRSVRGCIVLRLGTRSATSPHRTARARRTIKELTRIARRRQPVRSFANRRSADVDDCWGGPKLHRKVNGRLKFAFGGSGVCPNKSVDGWRNERRA